MKICILVVFCFFIVLVCLSIDKINLFLSSFSPLFLILFINELTTTNLKNLKNNVFILIVYFILIIIPSCILLLRFKSKYKKSQLPKKLINPQKLGDGIVSYIMTYIVPLSNWGVGTGIGKYLGSILVFLMVMILYIRFDLVYINPILAIFFNVYRADQSNGTSIFVITKLNFTNFSQYCKNTNNETRILPKQKMYKITNSFFYLSKK